MAIQSSPLQKRDHAASTSIAENRFRPVEFPNYPPRIFQCRTITPNPITLFVNHESRMETLKCYSNFLPGVSDSPIYFNYQLDSFAVRHYCSGHNIRECDTREQLSWGIRQLIDLSTSVPLRPIRSLKLPIYFIYDYGIIDPPRPKPQVGTYSAVIEPLLTEFDCLQESIIISGRPQKDSDSSGFDNSTEVQNLENCLTHTFEAEMERNSSFQIPEVTIYTEPLLLPIFCDEKEQANGSRVYENYDLKETADWFYSEF
ncbi:hypothetical protein EAE99_009866 [Botrytis elliptica]|nr:hypothetical protein EAE99_009866 [Botrytis elliptica]